MTVRVEPYLDDVFETFPRTSHRPCNATEAVALEIYRPPIARRFFYALMRYGALVMAIGAAGAYLSGCGAAAADTAAEEAALNSREWAGQQVCGALTPVWRDDKTLECLPVRADMAVQP